VGWAYSFLWAASTAFLSQRANPAAAVDCRFPIRSCRATGAPRRTPYRSTVSYGGKCFFSGVRFDPAICRVPSQEARLSVSEVALLLSKS